MKLIKFLLKSVTVMFTFLFALFFWYMYNEDSKTVENNEPVFIEIAEDKTKIEPIVVVLSEEVKEKEVIAVEPAIKQTADNKQEVTENPNKFYYSNLDEYSKLIYESFENQKNNLKTGTSIISIPNKISEILETEDDSITAVFSMALNAFEYDNPDVFYLDPSKMILYYERDNRGNYTIYIKNDEQYSNYLLDGFRNEQDIQSAQNKIDEIVSQIQNNINKYNNDYNKILYIHDWLTQNIKYDETISKVNKDTIYGAFVEGESVCGGYAKAFKYLLDTLNINSIIVQGIATNDQGTENHAWNYVELKDKWYGVDCTWDDPIIIGDLTNYTEQKYYTYFLKGQNVFNKDHKLFETFYGTDLRIKYPELSIENY